MNTNGCMEIVSCCKYSLFGKLRTMMPCLILRIAVNTIKTGAPAVSRSRSHEDLEATARSDKTVYAIKPKLPKITLPRFSGEITKFHAFLDSFESAVDKNPSLSAVDKFNYLNALLEGSAARSIQGLSLSKVNYTAATEILKERFRNNFGTHGESASITSVCRGQIFTSAPSV